MINCPFAEVVIVVLWYIIILNRIEWCQQRKVYALCITIRGSRAGNRGSDPPPPPWKSQNQYWSGSPDKLQSYQPRIQSWAIFGPPAKRHLNGISQAGRWWPAFSAIWILSLSSSTKNMITESSYSINCLPKFMYRRFGHFNSDGIHPWEYSCTCT